MTITQRIYNSKTCKTIVWLSVLVSTLVTMLPLSASAQQPYTRFVNYTSMSLSTSAPVESPIQISGIAGTMPAGLTLGVTIRQNQGSSFEVALVAPDDTTYALDSKTNFSGDYQVTLTVPGTITSETANGLWTLRVTLLEKGALNPFLDKWAMDVPTTPPPGMNFEALQSEITITSYTEVPVLEQTLTLRAGERRQIVGQVTAFSDTDDMLFSAAVQCVDAATGEQAGIAGWASTTLPNLSGTLKPSRLFTAPIAGHYRCRLLGGGDPNGGTMTILAGGGTWMAWSNGDEVYSQDWDEIVCTTTGVEPTCTYLGVSGGPVEAYLLDDNNAGEPWNVFRAAPDASAIAMRANVELTTCYKGSTSCKNGKLPGGGFSGSLVRSRLEAVQLDAQGQPCRRVRGPYRDDWISNFTHHYNIAYDEVRLPVSSTCGSRDFRLRVQMKWVKGNPVKIDGFVPGDSPQSQTSGYMVTLPH